jgi:hypothetical protein
MQADAKDEIERQDLRGGRGQLQIGLQEHRQDAEDEKENRRIQQILGDEMHHRARWPRRFSRAPDF